MLARKLRRTMTPPEAALWSRLRGRPCGVKFRRQHPIGPYVVDFCATQARLVVEVDGQVHDCGSAPVKDALRYAFLEENGFRVIRVAARRILHDADTTADAIVRLAASPLHQPAAGPPPSAGED